jgi:hypothetical protein
MLCFTVSFGNICSPSISKVYSNASRKRTSILSVMVAGLQLEYFQVRFPSAISSIGA